MCEIFSGIWLLYRVDISLNNRLFPTPISTKYLFNGTDKQSIIKRKLHYGALIKGGYSRRYLWGFGE